MDTSKGKKKTLTELVVGGGLFVVFLPLILFAFLWAVAAVGLALIFTIVFRDHLASFLPILVVYSLLLTIMIFETVKFGARFRMLFRRLVGILRERRRVREIRLDVPQKSRQEVDAIDYDDTTSENFRKQH